MEKPEVPARLDQPLTAEDRALFARVWKRVMPDESLSPIETVGVPQHSSDDFPAMLETLGGICLAGERTYAALSRCVGRGMRQSLLELSGAVHQQRKRIGAVFYLLTGRCLPPESGKHPASGTVPAVLRQQFRREQSGLALSEKGAQAALDSGRTWLAAVFSDSARQGYRRMEQLTDILTALSGG